MQDYRKLQVWKKAHELALEVYAVSPYLKRPEAWPVRDQVLRAAVSVPSNIAEGSGRGTNPDFSRFLWHSMGSCNELEYDLLLAKDFTFLPILTHHRLGEHVAEVRSMLTGLIKRIVLDR